MKETTASLLEQLQIETFHCAGQAFQSTMRLSSFHAQPFGFVNGGVYLAYGEALAGMASNAILAQDMLASSNSCAGSEPIKQRVAVGQSVMANHVRPKRCDGYVVARGQLLHKGGRNHVWTINIFDETDQLLSHMTVTNSIIISLDIMFISRNLCITRCYRYIHVNCTKTSIDRLVVHRYTL